MDGMFTDTRHDENVKNAMRKGLRIVGDVHGDLEAFRHAVATDRFIISWVIWWITGQIARVFCA